jgi:hypothetical protein
MVASLCAALSGCAGALPTGTSGDSSSDDLTNAPSTAGAVDHGVPVVDAAVDRAAIAAAIKAQDDALERLVGRYARGDAAIYRGSAAARDNNSVVGKFLGVPSSYRDGALSGDVTASLAREELNDLLLKGPGWALTLYAADQSRVSVHQPDSARGTSLVSLVLASSVVGDGVLASCTDCFADLSTKPATLERASLTAHGTYEGVDAPLVVTMTGVKLGRVRPVAFDDLVSVAAPGDDRDAMRAFAERDDEWIRAVVARGTYELPPPKGAYRCQRVTSYSVEWYVSRAELSKYGARHFAVTKSETCCDFADGPDGTSVCL